jgi:hypothetical protein
VKELDGPRGGRLREQPLALAGVAADRDHAVAAFGAAECERTPHSVGAAADDDGPHHESPG